MEILDFKGFLLITSNLHRNFQFWKKKYLVTKTSTQPLNLDPRGSVGETCFKWKAWMSSFKRYYLEQESWWEWWWNDFGTQHVLQMMRSSEKDLPIFFFWFCNQPKNQSRTKFSKMTLHVLKIYILIWFSCSRIKATFSLHFYYSKYSFFLTTYPPLNSNLICQRSPT